MPDTEFVLGVIIIIIFCIFFITKLVQERRKHKVEELPAPGEPVMGNGLIAAIAAAVNNYRNENS